MKFPNKVHDDDNLPATKGEVRKWQNRASAAFIVMAILITWALGGLLHNGTKTDQAVRENHRILLTQKEESSKFISNGIPATTCLLEVFRNVRPLLIDAPKVHAPLESFLLLQSHRYGEYECPTPQEAKALTKQIPKVK